MPFFQNNLRVTKKISSIFKKGEKGSTLIAVLIIILILSLLGTTVLVTTSTNVDMVVNMKKKDETAYELKVEMYKLLNYIRQSYVKKNCLPFANKAPCTGTEWADDSTINGTDLFLITGGQGQYFANTWTAGAGIPKEIHMASRIPTESGTPSPAWTNAWAINALKYAYYIFKPMIYPTSDRTDLWTSDTGTTTIYPLDRESNPPVLALRFMIVDLTAGEKTMNTLDAIILFYLYPPNEGQVSHNNFPVHPRVWFSCSSGWTATSPINCLEKLSQTGIVSALRYRTKKYSW